MSKNLEQRVEDVLDIARNIGHDDDYLADSRWERRMKGAIAQVFFLGMGVGWDKCVASMDDTFRDLTGSTLEDARKAADGVRETEDGWVTVRHGTESDCPFPTREDAEQSLEDIITDDQPLKDEEYWAEVERAAGKGTRSILWGTSTRSLRKHLARLKGQQKKRLDEESRHG